MPPSPSPQKNLFWNSRQIVAATRACSVRQRSTRGGDLCMRKTGKFVLSNKAKLNETGPKVVTMNMKTGEVIKVRHAVGWIP